MNFKSNHICQLLNISFPIIQGGMVWVSGGRLAAAVANEGGLGLVGAGSMSPDLLRLHLQKAKYLHKGERGALGVNIPLLYKGAKAQVGVALEEGFSVFVTSAGSPKTFTSLLKDQGKTVLHVVSSPLLAKKCEDAGVDIVIAEGFEAGGHNGRDELATMALVPQVVRCVNLPVVAAGGILTGGQMAAALCLGAEGVQIGTGFAATLESSAHPLFKKAIIEAGFADTRLSLKKHHPVRLLKNSFAKRALELEEKGASREELEAFLGKGRAKRGMHEGEIEEGELEIGQVCALVTEERSVKDYMASLRRELEEARGFLLKGTPGEF